MISKLSFGKVAIGAALIVGFGVAQAAATLTFNPGATNGGVGKVSNTDGVFQATGINGGLDSTLKIFGNTGIASFLETGRINLDTFTGLTPSGPSSTVTGLTVNWDLYADFTLSGGGFWSGGTYVMDTTTASMSMNLYGFNKNTLQTIQLASGTLLSSTLGLAQTFSENFGSVGGPTIVPPGSNSASAKKANSVFSGLIDLVPTGGASGAFTGVGGFFEAPKPFHVSLDAGSVGGSASNTSWTSSGGTVTILTGKDGGADRTSGSANITFVINQVPEPGSVALVGLALCGVAVATRRQTKKAVVA